ncbi:hypothetical protein [uncultured Hymenobacter sp.]|uniref:hypothetical protein n=1 Tax=uncultured Hymenobacter sp. TaxID=170016 RepID=UPI0035C9DEEB
MATHRFPTPLVLLDPPKPSRRLSEGHRPATAADAGAAIVANEAMPQAQAAPQARLATLHPGNAARQKHRRAQELALPKSVAHAGRQVVGA